MRVLNVVLVAALVWGGTACATGGAQTSGTDRTRLTREQIAAVDALSLYDVVLRLRPRWIEADRRASHREYGIRRGVVVFQDQTYLGGIDILRQMRPSMAYEMEWLDGTTASATLPSLRAGHVEGAIIIHPNRRR